MDKEYEEYEYDADKFDADQYIRKVMKDNNLSSVDLIKILCGGMGCYINGLKKIVLENKLDILKVSETLEQQQVSKGLLNFSTYITMRVLGVKEEVLEDCKKQVMEMRKERETKTQKES